MNLLPGGGIWVRSTALLDMARHAGVALNTYLLKDNPREFSKYDWQNKKRLHLASHLALSPVFFKWGWEMAWHPTHLPTFYTLWAQVSRLRPASAKKEPIGGLGRKKLTNQEPRTSRGLRCEVDRLASARGGWPEDGARTRILGQIDSLFWDLCSFWL